MALAIAVVSVAVFALIGTTGVITAASTVAPDDTAPPTISGTAEEGKTLTANKGTWTGTEPITYTYQWRRCDSDGGSCSSIGGATETTYLLKKVDVDNTLRLVVSAKNADGTAARTSVPTAVVKAAAVAPPPVADGCAKKGGAVPVAGVTPPARLTIDQTSVSPSAITHGTRSLTARFHVGACGGSVEGALVYVTAVPYGQFAIPNEQPTDSDGFVTLQFTAQAGYPVSSKQQLIVMFVRARKSGENILGGISSRRLVSFRVARG
jgi:hypothetical protein